MKKKLYLLFLAGIMVPVILVSCVFAVLNTQQLKKQDFRHVNNVLLTESTNIEAFANEIKRISSAPYQYDDIYSLLLQMKNGTIDNAGSAENDRLVNQYGLTFFKLLYSSSGDIRNIAFYPTSQTDSKIYFLSREYDRPQELSVPGYFDQDWFIEATEKGGNELFSGIRTSSYPGQRDTPNVITLTRVIKDLDTQKSIGVLRIDASADAITGVLSHLMTTDRSRIVLMDQNNAVIYQTGDLSADVLSQLKLGGNTVQDKHDTYYVSEQTISGMGWKLAYLSSRSDLFASTSNLIFLACLIALAAVAVAFVIYSMQSKKMVVSVESIIRTIQRLQEGDLSAKSSVRTGDEFLLISNALNEMGEQLDRHIKQEYQAVISQRNAEYRALQSQINPHFLFNTLNGFIALNRMGERRLLEKSIMELTQLFRYTCSNESTTTVADELEFAARYLELQKLRFEDRLNYSIHADQQAPGIRIPKLLLQPLVENCIVHGMEPTDEPIHISISAEVGAAENTAALLRITIEDDGVGFDLQTAQSGLGVGLTNVKDRLSYFRAASGFRIESTPGRGTCCVLTLPLDGDS